MMTWEDLEQQLSEVADPLKKNPHDREAKGRLLQTATYLIDQMGQDLVDEWFDINEEIRKIVGWETRRSKKETSAQLV